MAFSRNCEPVHQMRKTAAQRRPKQSRSKEIQTGVGSVGASSHDKSEVYRTHDRAAPVTRCSTRKIAFLKLVSRASKPVIYTKRAPVSDRKVWSISSTGKSFDARFVHGLVPHRSDLLSLNHAKWKNRPFYTRRESHSSRGPYLHRSH